MSKKKKMQVNKSMWIVDFNRFLIFGRYVSDGGTTCTAPPATGRGCSPCFTVKSCAAHHRGTGHACTPPWSAGASMPSFFLAPPMKMP